MNLKIVSVRVWTCFRGRGQHWLFLEILNRDMNRVNAPLLVLLNFLMAFDTINHSIFRLEGWGFKVFCDQSASSLVDGSNLCLVEEKLAWLVPDL